MGHSEKSIEERDQIFEQFKSTFADNDIPEAVIHTINKASRNLRYCSFSN